MTFTSPVPVKPMLSVAPERAQLDSWLDYHRAVLLSKLEGLTAEQAGKRMVPSLTTLHGLVRHMACVEHVWFVTILSGSDEPNYHGKNRSDWDAEWRLDDGDFDAEYDLDEVRKHHRLGEGDLRWILIHMIEEYAQHNGHADIIRELVDGTTAS